MTRRASAAVVSVLTLAVLVSACGRTVDRAGEGPVLPPPAPPTTSAPGTAPPPPPLPAPTSAPTRTPTTPATEAPTEPPVPQAEAPVDDWLRPGDQGPAVLAWQQQLVELGYWLGAPDGTFGTLTLQATYALQKAAGLSRDGVVGPATRRALAEGVRPQARTTSGSAVEIDLARQLLLVVRSGVVQFVLNTSTGSGETYLTSSGGTARAVTPRGSYRVYAQIDGLRISPLGELWRPKFFNGGIAIHGAPQVPPWPASHGCVRLTDAAMNWIWQTGRLPIGAAVLVR